MKKLFQMMRKKKWIFGVLLLFFVAFLVWDGFQDRDVSHAADYYIVDSEGTEIGSALELRRATESFRVLGTANSDTIKWSLPDNNEILEVADGTGTNTNQLTVNALKNGTIGVFCEITPGDGSDTVTLSFSVTVVFSINEFLTGVEDVAITRALPDDERRSIVMLCNTTLQLGEDAKSQREKLNLIFGNAASDDAVWESSNPDVVRVTTVTVEEDGKDVEKKAIMAVGTGSAQLSVSYSDGTIEGTDTIRVYVRPELYLGTDEGHNSPLGDETIVMETGDKLWLPALYSANPLEGILDKVTWVITKRGTSTDLVQDSMGNQGANWEDANLVYDTVNGTFRLDAKAGHYVILFYVKGIYNDYETSKEQEEYIGCRPVTLNVDVNSKFADKEITIGIGGSYNLCDAFNISKHDMDDYFRIDTIQNAGQWIDWNLRDLIATGVAEGGAAVIPVMCTGGTATIPGVSAGSMVNVRIKVTDTFALNVSSAIIAVGQRLDLQGVIGSGQYSETSVFKWECSDTRGTYVSMSGNGLQAQVTGVRATSSTDPVRVTLSWTNDAGVTQVASCEIYVNSSATTIPLTPTELELTVGDTTFLSSGLTGSQNLTWMSADTDIVTVEPMEGNIRAMVTAGQTTGTTIITVLNKDNNVYATCRVTVTAAITGISIAQGENIDTVLSAGFVFLSAVYTPANATNTELKWTTSDPTVATVDENGVVTLLKEDTVWISVEPVFNPDNIVARCRINIKKNPVTDIELDVTELKLIAGDQYEIKTNVIPADATYPTLTWATDNENIARVEGGVITAVAPGDANITVANGEVFKIIKVNVRARLLSIAFTEKQYDIKVGSTANLTQAVIFNPSEDVNTNLSWSSSNTSIVTVDENGIITGVESGTDAWAIITCVAEDLGVTGSISCIVHVIDQDVPATSVTLSPEEATIHVGETLQINSIFDPVTATYQQMNWSSTDPTLATVDENGLVTALEEGTVNIGAVYRDPITNEVWEPVYCKITILKAHVYVQGVELSPNNMEVFIGQSLPVSPVFTPEDSTDKGVTYQSSNADIANVDETGSVTGVSSGSAVIICRTNEGGYIATCNVKVIAGVSIALSPTYREIAKGKTFTISKTILPEEYADTPVTWASSNEKIATVTKNGKVKGIKNGECVISCTLDNYGSKAVCQVKVAALRTTISLNKTNIRIGKGQTYRLKATVWSNNSTTPSVKWTTSNRKIARVGQKGLVRAKKIGYATITATTTDTIKKKATCRVRVIKRATGVVIRPNYAVCYVGRTKKLTAVVKPKTATIKTVSWKTSDKNIAAVTSGVVRGISAGTVNITATTKDGSRKRAVCVVKVLDEVPATSIVVAQTELTLKRGDTAKLSYTVLPNNTSDSLKFASDNKRVATVNSKGVVKAVGTGSCTITIMSTGGTTSTVEVNVVALNRTTLTMRQYDTETLTVNGTTDRVTWYSANASIATVENGKVVGRKKGTTYVYAYVKGCTLACKVTITDIK